MLLNHSLCTAQAIDTMQSPVVFSGVITATNNGISLIPNFSLNKSAILFDLSLSKKRLSFDPMFRFGTNGKPWSFIFWWRYKMITGRKFTMSLGAHPAFLFRSQEVSIGSSKNEVLSAQRYFAWEVSPNVQINKNFSLGLYYLGSHGLTKDLVQYTHFLSLRLGLPFISLSKGFRLSIQPQIYLLKLDQLQGSYLTATLSLWKSKFPLILNSTINKTTRTELAGNDIVWNVGVSYNFRSKFLRQK